MMRVSGHEIPVLFYLGPTDAIVHDEDEVHLVVIRGGTNAFGMHIPESTAIRLTS